MGAAVSRGVGATHTKLISVSKLREAHMFGRTGTQLAVLVAALLLASSCADDDQSQPWRVDEPPPESTVNQQLCQDMPGAGLDAPQVTDLEGDVWRIRYPVFEQGCGVRQLDVDIRFEDDGTARASYKTAVCNRCDQPQQLNALDDYMSWMNVNPPEERLPIPQDPRVTPVPTLFVQGRPVVRLAGDSVARRSCPGTVSTRAETVMYPSYSSLWRVTLEPGEQSERREGGGDAEPLLDMASEASFDALRVYWPRMYHRDVSITGLQAASESEFCERPVYEGESLNSRPYAEPYRLDAKYVRQTTDVPDLPNELAERLRAAAQDAQF